MTKHEDHYIFSVFSHSVEPPHRTVFLFPKALFTRKDYDAHRQAAYEQTDGEGAFSFDGMREYLRGIDGVIEDATVVTALDHLIFDAAGTR